MGLPSLSGNRAMNATSPDGRGVPESGFVKPPAASAATSTLEKAEFDASNVPAAEKGLFNRVEFDQRHRDRVYRCQKMTQRQAECFAQAPSMQYIQNCERFAELQ